MTELYFRLKFNLQLGVFSYLMNQLLVRFYFWYQAKGNKIKIPILTLCLMSWQCITRANIHRITWRIAFHINLEYLPLPSMYHHIIMLLYSTNIKYITVWVRKMWIIFLSVMLSEMDNYYFFKNCNMSRSLFSLFIFEHAKGNEYPLLFNAKTFICYWLSVLMLKIYLCALITITNKLCTCFFVFLRNSPIIHWKIMVFHASIKIVMNFMIIFLFEKVSVNW